MSYIPQHTKCCMCRSSGTYNTLDARGHVDQINHYFFKTAYAFIQLYVQHLQYFPGPDVPPLRIPRLTQRYGWIKALNCHLYLHQGFQIKIYKSVYYIKKYITRKLEYLVESNVMIPVTPFYSEGPLVRRPVSQKAL